MSLGKGMDSFSVAVVLCGPGTDQNHEITASLGSSLGPPRVERSYSSEGTRTDRCWPLLTAVDRCLGHVRGTAGEGEHGSGLAAMAPARREGGARPW